MRIKFGWVQVRVCNPLIPVLNTDQVDQGYKVIRSWCESANKVPQVRIRVRSVRERLRKTQISIKIDFPFAYRFRYPAFAHDE